MYTYNIIIPHKNSPKLLQRCLDSIPHRDDLHIIVVDDNSDPNKVDFGHFPGYDRDDVELIFTKEGKGAGYARNVGLENTNSEWVLFSDSDDFYIDGFLDILDQNLDPNQDVIYFSINCYDSKTQKYTDAYRHIRDKIEGYSIGKSDLDSIRYHINNPWCKLVRMDYIKKYNIRFEEIIRGNDVLFSFQVGYLTNRIKVIPNRLYTYTLNYQGLSLGKWNSKKYRCYFSNMYKMNQFYRFIGKSSWKYNIFLKFKKLLLKNKNDIFALVRIIISYFWTYITHGYYQNYYINVLKSKSQIR